MRLISMKQVCEKTSLARASIYRKVEDGKFPKPLALDERKLSESRNTKRGVMPGQLTGRIAFVESEVDEWIAKRMTQRLP